MSNDYHDWYYRNVPPRGFGVPPRGDGHDAGAEQRGRDWAIIGALTGLAILTAPGRTLGDKVRRTCQIALWEAAAAFLLWALAVLTPVLLVWLGVMT
jgi:hypothetical protein